MKLRHMILTTVLPVLYLVLVLFYRGGNWDSRLSNVSKITKLITGEAGV